MNNWKKAFLSGASKFEDREELEINYTFGSPASTEDLRALKQAINLEIPKNLLDLMKEFNGIEVDQKYWGKGQLYLSINFIIKELPKYFQESGNYLPPKNESDSVIFFAQQNGMAALFALCVKPFNTFNVGEVLALESDSGEFVPEALSLEDFVQSGSCCHLG